MQVVYANPSDREIKFLVSAPLVDPVAALPFARAICWCAAIPFSAPGFCDDLRGGEASSGGSAAYLNIFLFNNNELQRSISCL